MRAAVDVGAHRFDGHEDVLHAPGNGEFVHRVRDLTADGPSVQRELALVKVASTGERRVESLRIADIFRARVVDSTNESFVFEIVGKTGKLDAFIRLMEPLGLIDVSRTGVAAISRGGQSL